MADNTKTPRPVFTNIHVTDIVSYKLPPAGIVSILHRISGVVMFLLLPFVVWMFDTSLSSEISYDEFKSVFTAGSGWLPAILVNVITWGLIWAYLHHFIAGVRHLLMDTNHHLVEKKKGQSSAIATLVLSVGLTLILGAKLFGLF
ncbi:succinate dehydrogenase, cytochrome b556 subunit [Aquabacterium sp.]|uniref:succinate dehydrogenase, cytochrome b556 subunit n=1 Tax=Aquabacterium sp. TaxID=1872578 RepID=UPI00248A29FC|nr:succinate dehydrogenase, cytochrome b556 subunit [Aquabacterium sp.]MDI1260184.1 succinate dehydrogenase, cytochrome b556 subunit [Aquabacterium sp.]